MIDGWIIESDNFQDGNFNNFWMRNIIEDNLDELKKKIGEIYIYIYKDCVIFFFYINEILN